MKIWKIVVLLAILSNIAGLSASLYIDPSFSESIGKITNSDPFLGPIAFSGPMIGTVLFILGGLIWFENHLENLQKEEVEKNWNPKIEVEKERLKGV